MPAHQLAPRSATLATKPASPWGRQPNLGFSLEDSLKRSCREIQRVCPERYRDTFLDETFF